VPATCQLDERGADGCDAASGPERSWFRDEDVTLWIDHGERRPFELLVVGGEVHGWGNMGVDRGAFNNSALVDARPELGED
jgi:hypothetical protein